MNAEKRFSKEDVEAAQKETEALAPQVQKLIAALHGDGCTCTTGTNGCIADLNHILMDNINITYRCVRGKA